MGFVPHKEAMVGFALQSDLFTAATEADIILPLTEGTSFNWKPNINFYQNIQGNYELTHYYSGGEWLEFSVTFPIIPGMLIPSDTGLYEWAFDRDESDYNQGYWATFFEYLGNSEYKVYSACKCTKGSIDVKYGERAMITFEGIGIRTPVDGSSANFPSGADLMTGLPYIYKEASVSLNYTTGGAYAADTNTSDHKLSWDNQVVSPSDIGTLNGVEYPMYLPNSANAQWTGQYSRTFVDDDVRDAFLNRQECKYKLTMARSGVASAILEFPRIVYSDANVAIPNDGIIKQDGISFQALGGVDETAAFTFTETAA